MSIELILRDTETGREQKVDTPERCLIWFTRYEGYVVRNDLERALDRFVPDLRTKQEVSESG